MSALLACPALIGSIGSTAPSYGLGGGTPIVSADLPQRKAEGKHPVLVRKESESVFASLQRGSQTAAFPNVLDGHGGGHEEEGRNFGSGGAALDVLQCFENQPAAEGVADEDDFGVLGLGAQLKDIFAKKLAVLYGLGELLMVVVGGDDPACRLDSGAQTEQAVEALFISRPIELPYLSGLSRAQMVFDAVHQFVITLGGSIGGVVEAMHQDVYAAISARRALLVHRGNDGVSINSQSPGLPVKDAHRSAPQLLDDSDQIAGDGAEKAGQETSKQSRQEKPCEVAGPLRQFERLQPDWITKAGNKAAGLQHR